MECSREENTKIKSNFVFMQPFCTYKFKAFLKSAQEINPASSRGIVYADEQQTTEHANI
jgi:hypothetical protein